jgi:hypothetical protein
MQKNPISDFHPQPDRLHGIFRGVVEDRNDPEKMGRCRVRVFGVHSPNKEKTDTDGIPTDELPWAEPAFGLIGGSISGFGLWSVPLQGSHVFLFYENGNIMEPRYFSTVPGLPASADTAVRTRLEKRGKNEYPRYADRVKDAGQWAANDISQNPGREEYKATNQLGKTSERYESGGRGPGTISSGHGDFGGVSYGVYQFESNNGSLQKYIRQSAYGDEFVGLNPATEPFNAKWREIAQREPEEFRADQHAYVAGHYYDTACSLLKAQLGIDVPSRCFGLQELVWSTAVQFGANGCLNVFRRAGASGRQSSHEIIDRVYREKSRTEAYFRSSSPEVQQSVKRRYMSEHVQNLAHCEFDMPEPDQLTPALAEASAQDLWEMNTLGEEEFVERYVEDEIEAMRTESLTGFMDPLGEYPLMSRIGEPDFHRLARGEASKTLVEYKTNNLVEGTELANGKGEWDEPEPAYSARYPDNIVLATHSGLTIEVDSTPDAPRFHVYHPSNTYIEVDARGNVIVKAAGSVFEICGATKNVRIFVDENRTIDGSQTVKVGEDRDVEVGRDENVHIHNDRNEKIDNDENKEVGGDWSIDVSGSVTLGVGGDIDASVGGSAVVNSSGSVTVQAGGPCTIRGATVLIN